MLISVHGEVKLADFGIAKVAGRAAMTEAGSLKGKIVYMSPEQAWGRAVDGRSDLYSLGLIMYELLTNRRALDADSEIAVLENARAATIAPLGAVDPALAKITMRALAADPAQRYATAGALREALLVVLASGADRDPAQELGALVREVREYRAAASSDPATDRVGLDRDRSPGPTSPTVTRPETIRKPAAAAARCAAFPCGPGRIAALGSALLGAGSPAIRAPCCAPRTTPRRRSRRSRRRRSRPSSRCRESRTRFRRRACRPRAVRPRGRRARARGGFRLDEAAHRRDACASGALGQRFGRRTPHRTNAAASLRGDRGATRGRRAPSTARLTLDLTYPQTRRDAARTSPARRRELMQPLDGEATFVSHAAAGQKARPGTRVRVVTGPDVPLEVLIPRTGLTIGSGADCAMRLSDKRVSRQHVHVLPEGDGFRIRDLGSSNGTFLDEARIADALAPAGATLRIGKSALRLVGPERYAILPPSTRSAFGELVGASLPMREVFGVLEAAAAERSLGAGGRRDRHRQGAGRTRCTITRVRARRARSWPSIVARSRPISSKVDCSATCAARAHRRRTRRAPACSSARARRRTLFLGRSWASSRSSCNPSSCACSRRARCGRSAASTSAPWTYASSPVPTGTSKRWSKKVRSAPTSTTDSRSCMSRCHRCARAPKTCRC